MGATLLLDIFQSGGFMGEWGVSVAAKIGRNTLPLQQGFAGSCDTGRRRNRLPSPQCRGVHRAAGRNRQRGLQAHRVHRKGDHP